LARHESDSGLFFSLLCTSAIAALREKPIASGDDPAPSMSAAEFREWAAKSGAGDLELTSAAGAHVD
jgi:hypothetical protein